MAKKEIKVDCPFCHGVLWVNPETGEVVHQEKGVRDRSGDFDEFLASRDKAETELERKFREAREKEKSKIDRLQKKFDWAKENPDKISDDGGPRLI